MTLPPLRLCAGQLPAEPADRGCLCRATRLPGCAWLSTGILCDLNSCMLWRALKQGEPARSRGSNRPGSAGAPRYASRRFSRFKQHSPCQRLHKWRMTVLHHVVLIACRGFFSSQDEGPCPRAFGSSLPRQRRARDHLVCVR